MGSHGTSGHDQFYSTKSKGTVYGAVVSWSWTVYLLKEVDESFMRNFNEMQC